MKEFFSQTMGIGRYPDKTILDIFCRNRPYFDQVLHKNVKFRRAYGEAFQKWVDQDEMSQNQSHLRLQRILLAVQLMGEDQIRSLFGQMIEAINEKYPHQELPPDIDFMATIQKTYEGLEDYKYQLSLIELFWSRVAVPEIWIES